MNRLYSILYQRNKLSLIMATIGVKYWFQTQRQRYSLVNRCNIRSQFGLRLADLKTRHEVYNEAIKSFVTVRQWRVDSGGEAEFISSSSGFIVHQPDLIITNSHCVEDLKNIDISVFGVDPDNDQDIIETEVFTARVVYIEPQFDLALLRFKASDMPFIPLTPLRFVSNEGMAGQEVISLGNPQIFNTICDGIITFSGTKQVGTLNKGDYEYNHFMSNLSTPVTLHNCPTTVGYSGGPLLDMNGQVVGVNFAGVELHEECATTAQQAKDFIERALDYEIKWKKQQTIESNRENYSFKNKKSLGITLYKFDYIRRQWFDNQKLQQMLGQYINSNGFIVANVLNPDESLFQCNDIITQINGDMFATIDGMRESLYRNNMLDIKVIRNGRELEFTVDSSPVHCFAI